METHSNDQDLRCYPSVVFLGGSGEGKTATLKNMVHADFQSSMEMLVGDPDANTTPTLTPTVIDPNARQAAVTVLGIKSGEEIRANICRHLKSIMVPEIKNCLSSRPKKKEDLDGFYHTCMQKRLVPKDPTFRIEKLLEFDPNVWNRYLEILVTLLKLIDQTADSAFRSSYFEYLKVSKPESGKMVEVLIDQALFPEKDDEQLGGINKGPGALIDELCDLILSKAKMCLKEAGFICDESGMWSAHGEKNDFERAVRAVTNSKKERGTASAACAIQGIRIHVPGPGVPGPYCIYDAVGFDNDGIEGIGRRIKEALLTPVYYDGIVFIKNINSPLAKNRDYLAAIKESVRPSKLMMVITRLDQAELFDRDEEAAQTEVWELKEALQKQACTLAAQEIGNDCRVQLPSERDIVCFANVRNKRRLGETAYNLLNPEESAEQLRLVICRAYNTVRRKIKKHNINPNLKSSFLVSREPLDKIVGQMIDQLTNAISLKYGALRANSENIHHWTVDAILWNLYNGNDFVSHAQVWDDPAIHTYENIVKICMKNLMPVKPAPGINIEDGLDRLMKDFEANLRAELNKCARTLLLGRSNEENPCKKELLRLAHISKYNKWTVFEDTRKCLLTAVSQQELLKELLEEALKAANETTHYRLII